MGKVRAGISRYLMIFIATGIMLSLVACATPETTATPTATGTNPRPSLTLTAENLAFDQSVMRFGTGVRVIIEFVNKDNVEHNLAIYKTEAAEDPIFVGEIITGPDTIFYEFTAPYSPGTYFFRCDIHPTQMTGDFIVYGTAS